MSVAVSWTTFAKITYYEEIDFIDKNGQSKKYKTLFFWLKILLNACL